MNLEAIYHHLPEMLQDVAILLEGYKINRRRYDNEYFDLFDQVLALEKLPKDSLDEWRSEKLSSFLQSASTSPYWGKKFLDFRVNPAGKYPFEEIEKLPILSKDEVKANSSNILNPQFRKNSLIIRHTSGSTGSGLIFPELKSCEKMTWAFWWRFRKWHAIDRSTWCGYFAGRTIVSPTSSRKKYWKYNSPGKQVLFSGYHLSEDTLPIYLKAIKDFRLPWLHGYPSSLVAVAQLAKTLNIPINLPDLRVISIGAENLAAWQKKVLVNAFNVPVIQHYGQAESISNISECPLGRLHVDEEHSLTEFVGINTSTEKSIVGTNWMNPAFPLIRYDSGDVASLDEGACPCGRKGRLVKNIDGRKEDYLTLADGRKIGRLDHIFKDMLNIRAAQFRQRSVDDIELRLIRTPYYNDRDEIKLLGEIKQRLGPDIPISIRYVEEISKTKSGKTRLVQSDVT